MGLRGISVALFKSQDPSPPLEVRLWHLRIKPIKITTWLISTLLIALNSREADPGLRITGCRPRKIRWCMVRLGAQGCNITKHNKDRRRSVREEGIQRISTRIKAEVRNLAIQQRHTARPVIPEAALNTARVFLVDCKVLASDRLRIQVLPNLWKIKTYTPRQVSKREWLLELKTRLKGCTRLCRRKPDNPTNGFKEPRELFKVRIWRFSMSIIVWLPRMESFSPRWPIFVRKVKTIIRTGSFLTSL